MGIDNVVSLDIVKRFSHICIDILLFLPSLDNVSCRGCIQTENGSVQMLWALKKKCPLKWRHEKENCCFLLRVILNKKFPNKAYGSAEKNMILSVWNIFFRDGYPSEQQTYWVVLGKVSHMRQSSLLENQSKQ